MQMVKVPALSKLELHVISRRFTCVVLHHDPLSSNLYTIKEPFSIQSPNFRLQFYLLRAIYPPKTFHSPSLTLQLPYYPPPPQFLQCSPSTSHKPKPFQPSSTVLGYLLLLSIQSSFESSFSPGKNYGAMVIDSDFMQDSVGIFLTC